MHRGYSCALVQATGLEVKDVVVLIDREQGGEARLKSHGLTLHSAFPLTLILQVGTCSYMRLQLVYCCDDWFVSCQRWCKACVREKSLPMLRAWKMS